MRSADRLRLATFALGAIGLAGCAARDARPEPAAKPLAAETTAAAPAAAAAPGELPPDSLVILVTGKNAYTVQDATTTCDGLTELVKPYRQSVLVVTGAQGVVTTIADVICVGRLAKQRGGTAYFAHPDGGLRTVDVQD